MTFSMAVVLKATKRRGSTVKWSWFTFLVIFKMLAWPLDLGCVFWTVSRMLKGTYKTKESESVYDIISDD